MLSGWLIARTTQICSEQKWEEEKRKLRLQADTNVEKCGQADLLEGEMFWKFILYFALDEKRLLLITIRAHMVKKPKHESQVFDIRR